MKGFNLVSRKLNISLSYLPAGTVQVGFQMFLNVAYTHPPQGELTLSHRHVEVVYVEAILRSALRRCRQSTDPESQSLCTAVVLWTHVPKMREIPRASFCNLREPRRECHTLV